MPVSRREIGFIVPLRVWEKTLALRQRLQFDLSRRKGLRIQGFESSKEKILLDPLVP